MIKIYTKKGDGGKTFLGNGKIVWKDNQRVKAYGCLDELNSWLGLIIFFSKKDMADNLFQIQSDLMRISSILANPKIKKDATIVKKIQQLESLIDKLEKNLSPLKNFILPGGSLLSSYFHITRTVCRRAEREVITLSRNENINPEITVYLNRLSDLFFVLARWVNRKDKVKEKNWKI